jgi:hypothetical protein
MTNQNQNIIEDTESNNDPLPIEYDSSEQEVQPFSEVVKTWFKFPKFSKELLQSEIKNTNITYTLWGVLILSVILTILKVIYPIAECTFIPEQADSFSCPHYIFPSRVFGEFIKSLFYFYFSQLAVIVLMKIFGGKGNYSTQAYITMLYYVPFNLLAQASLFFQLIPVVGIYITYCLNLAFIILGIVFQIRMFQTVHELSRKKSILIILIPIALYFLSLLLLSSMGPSVGTVYEGNLDEFFLTLPPAP